MLRSSAVDTCRQVVELGKFERDSDGQRYIESRLDLEQHRDGRQRVAADGEEVVGPRDVRDAQHLLPDANELGLGLVFPRLARGRWRLSRRFQRLRADRLAIHFPTRRQRQRGEEHESRRDQWRGQRCREVTVQRFRGDRHAGCYDHGRDQRTQAVTRGEPRRRHLAHARVAEDRRLDFHGLDADAADLELVVVAAKVVDGSIGVLHRDVTGAVEAAAALTRDHEALAGQGFVVSVATRHLLAADPQFALGAGGDRLTVLAHHAHFDVGQRLADRSRDRRAFWLRRVQLETLRGHPHRGLGRPVQVPRRIGETGEPARELRRDCVAPAHGDAQAWEVGDLREQDGPHRGPRLERRDAVTPDLFGQAAGLEQQPAVTQHDHATGDQRQEDLAHRQVEADRRGREPAVGLGEPKQVA